MATQGHLESEQNAETTAVAVKRECEAFSIPFPALQRDVVGVRKWDRSDDARQIRYSNTALQGWNLPKPDGSTNQDGKSVFTSRFHWLDLTVPEAVCHLIESGQFDDAVDELIEARGYDRAVAELFMAYNLFIVAKGWVAERQIAENTEMSKLWESNDLAGQDFQKNDEYIQLKSWTFGLHGMDFDGDATVVYYGWIDGEMVYSEDYTDVTDKLSDVGGVNFDDLRNYEWVEKFEF